MKLSDFKDEKAVEVLGKLMEPMAVISFSEAIEKIRDEMGKLAEIESEQEKKKASMKMVGQMLQAEPKALKDMIAILNDKDPETYECTFLDIMQGMGDIMNDPQLRKVFF